MTLSRHQPTAAGVAVVQGIVWRVCIYVVLEMESEQDRFLFAIKRVTKLQVQSGLPRLEYNEFRKLSYTKLMGITR